MLKIMSNRYGVNETDFYNVTNWNSGLNKTHDSTLFSVDYYYNMIILSKNLAELGKCDA